MGARASVDLIVRQACQFERAPDERKRESGVVAVDCVARSMASRSSGNGWLAGEEHVIFVIHGAEVEVLEDAGHGFDARFAVGIQVEQVDDRARRGRRGMLDRA